MSWEGVPWMIGGGAEHSAEVGRLLAYAAAGAGEGVVGPADCKVVPSGVPDGNIHIQPGAVAVLNQFAGGGQQAYLVRNVGDEVKAMTPQGSSGPRYDLVAVIIEDPQYPGQPVPASVPDGPYAKTVVYENVPATTKSLAEVDAAQAGYALARVKFDASDGTVNAADITDLREMVAPRTRVIKKVLSGSATVALPAGAYGAAPPAASFAVPIPSWAKKVLLECIWGNILFTDTGSGVGYSQGGAMVSLGTIDSEITSWQADASGVSKPVTQTIMAAGDKDVPLALRGTTQNLVAKFNRGATSGMTANTTTYTTVVATATFYETVE